MISRKQLKIFFQAAFQEAEKGSKQEDGGPARKVSLSDAGGPFGALVVKAGQIVGKGHNTVWKENDPTSHAEIKAIRQAGKLLKSPHLQGCCLVTTSEPCLMCLSAAYWARVSRIYYCLPKSVAANFGFIDSFIDEDLKKAPLKRKTALVHCGDFESDGKKLFHQWRANKGKIY